MALDPSKIEIREDASYAAGQINFKLGAFRNVTVKNNNNSNELIIRALPARIALVRHSAELLRQALGYAGGLIIDVESEIDELRHCGLGSSSNTIACVGYAINEFFGNPISPIALMRYLARNHGEEIDANPKVLSPVQCIGGSAAAGITDGGVFVIAGSQTVIATQLVPDDFTIVLGIPTDFEYPDAEYLLKKEAEAMPKFLHTGRQYGPEIAYRLVHEGLPDLVEGRLSGIGRLIYDYRFKMGSIDNCSFVYPRMNEIAQDISPLFEEHHAEILALSSVGPGFFAVTRESSYCEEIFSASGLTTYSFKPHNGKYNIVYG